MSSELAAAIFDLDGVVTATARVHARAWQTLFDDYLQSRPEPFLPFDPVADYQRYVDGRPREDGIRCFLAARGITLTDSTLHTLSQRKNVYFQQALAIGGVEAFADTLAFIDRLKAQGVRVGVASSSRNCQAVLARAGLSEVFPVRVDGEWLARTQLPGKPQPALFLHCADRLGVAPARTLVAEDAVSGVQAARAGGFGLVLGVARHGQDSALADAGADGVIHDFSQLTLEQLNDWFRQHRPARRV